MIIIFGFSGIEEVDVITGHPTKVEDLIGKPEENASSDGRRRFIIRPGAGFTIAGGKNESGSQATNSKT